MADLIDRRAAIDALDCINGVEEVLRSLPSAEPTITHEQAIDYLHKTGWLQNHDRILTESKIVPSAQPDVPDTNVGDMISRQAAIDALWKALYEYEDRTEKQFQDSDELDVEDWILHRIFVQNMSDIDRQTIMDLPSAQSERTCVNCGRTVNNGGWYADGRTRCPIEEHYALPKDGYCHLWEKRNVTDDDYPERRTDE